VRYTRAIAVVGLSCVICITTLLGGCASPAPYRRETYVVKPQDTLYSIAWRHDLDYRELAQWNNIGSDYRLTVGQVLVLQPAGRAAARGAAPAQPATASRAQSAPRVAKAKPPTQPPAGAAVGTSGGAGGAAAAPPAVAPGPMAPASTGGSIASNGRPTQWLWPTDHSAPPRPVPGGGILLYGKLGQDVRAAGAGRVVYTGSGIRGYGNLIIVKHGDNMLSSYAHNSEMLVHEGQDVALGQIIAHMGTAAHQTSALYFEIRLNGKPVDPLRYLPVAK
jgi:lipoprotein NlpD